MALLLLDTQSCSIRVKNFLLALLVLAVCQMLAELSSISKYMANIVPTSDPNFFGVPSEANGKSAISLQDLTSNSFGNISCPQPLVSVHSTVKKDPYAGGRKIPRRIHITTKSRCMPRDKAKTIEKWKQALPGYSIFFHDDEAVDRLLQQDSWPEFPFLSMIMKCVKFRGAMKIDVWRMLVVYRYGGMYTDIDNWPGPLFNGDTILPKSTAFFLSDSWLRPSQWLFAMEPQHPVAYYCIMEILQRLLSLDNIAEPKVVFVTGPDALKSAYGRFLNWKPEGKIFGGGIFVGHYSKQVQKISQRDTSQYALGNLGGTYNDIVAWNATMNMTRREKVEHEDGIVHWLREVRTSSKRARRIPCIDYLYSLENTTGVM